MRAPFHTSHLETGWYFPESLSTKPISKRPRNPEQPVPTMDEYLEIINTGLALTALEAVNRENNPAMQAAHEAKLKAFESIIWKHDLKPAV